MASLTIVLFRDGRGDGGGDLAAILGDIVRSRAERHAVRQVDIHEHPGLAARYSVRTTPTILLMKDGDGYFSTASSTRGRRTPIPRRRSPDS